MFYGKVSKQNLKCIEFRMEEVAYKASAIVVDSEFWVWQFNYSFIHKTSSCRAPVSLTHNT